MYLDPSRRLRHRDLFRGGYQAVKPWWYERHYEYHTSGILCILFCRHHEPGRLSGCCTSEDFKRGKEYGALITATVAACITMALTTGNSYLSILIPGEMFRDAYKERGLAAKNLSRTLEDAGTVVVPLIPWSAAGAYMASTLGVETLDYLPWAILCYTGWIFAIIWGFTGFGIAKLADEKKKEN